MLLQLGRRCHWNQHPRGKVLRRYRTICLRRSIPGYQLSLNFDWSLKLSWYSDYLENQPCVVVLAAHPSSRNRSSFGKERSHQFHSRREVMGWLGWKVQKGRVFRRFQRKMLLMCVYMSQTPWVLYQTDHWFDRRFQNLDWDSCWS